MGSGGSKGSGFDRFPGFDGFLVLVMLIAAAPSVVAHHGYTDFDRERVVTIEGTLEHIVYGNPHIVLQVKTATDTFTASWESPNMVSRRAQFTSSTLKVGDRLVISGCPARDTSVKVLSLLKAVERPKDGWRWSVPAYDRPAK